MSHGRRIGALTIAATLLLGLASNAEAYVVKKTSRGELVHWETATVEYTIDPSIERAVPTAVDATLSAMTSWSGTVGAPMLATTGAGPSTPTFDERNGIFFMKDGWAPAGRALAITVLTYDNATGRILDADIIFNGSYSSAVLDAAGGLTPDATTTHVTNTDRIGHEDEDLDVSRGLVYDLHHVIAHELGHSLGMNDEMGRKDALMYRYSAPNDATIREPASDDIAGLAELYSTKLEARGSSGCGNATVAAKKPSQTAGRAAMFATMGLLLFLVLRARSDRRARAAFVMATAAAAVAFLPTVSGGRGVASAEVSSSAHGRARVLQTSTAIEHGLFRTQYALATTTCRMASCPKSATGTAWGGTIGNITQEVGGHYAPHDGDEVDVSFKNLPKALEAVMKPLAGRLDQAAGEAAVITR